MFIKNTFDSRLQFNLKVKLYIYYVNHSCLNVWLMWKHEVCDLPLTTSPGFTYILNFLSYFSYNNCFFLFHT